uniref:ANK_REP_REGION domain-containing protein n=1 Tax=Globodera rostochiensis TaxID=31243 RepID=A0A914I6M8_GLORO
MFFISSHPNGLPPMARKEEEEEDSNSSISAFAHYSELSVVTIRTQSPCETDGDLSFNVRHLRESSIDGNGTPTIAFSSSLCRFVAVVVTRLPALIDELPEVEKMPAQQRIALARERREQQLRLCQQRDGQLPVPAPRRPRLRFSADIALLETTVRGEVQEVEIMLMDGVNPNSHNEDGLTPLHQCAIDNNERIVRLLLRFGADVNAKDTENWTPLHAAACCGYIDIVRLLIKHADLLAVNADGNMPYDICDDEQTLDLIESEMAGQGITQEMIDERRQLPEREMLSDMKLLHQQGIPLDQRMPDESTYLHIAAANGFYDVAAFLLRCGVSPASRDKDSWMPIHAAASWNQPDLIELLCEYGADISAKTRNGETPLDLTEDPQTQLVIRTIAQTEARRKRIGHFGVRDSRRQSRKRKKFESPQAVPPAANTDFIQTARGAIRRQSLRDRSGMTLARLDSQREGSDLIRSWSKEDVSNEEMSAHPFGNGGPSTSHQPTTNQPRRDSPPKRMQKQTQQKQKQMSPDEWLKKLEAESGGFRDEEEEQQQAERDGLKGSMRKGVKAQKGNGVVRRDQQQHEANGMNLKGALGGQNRRRKKSCCCII